MCSWRFCTSLPKFSLNKVLSRLCRAMWVHFFTNSSRLLDIVFLSGVALVLFSPCRWSDEIHYKDFEGIQNKVWRLFIVNEILFIAWKRSSLTLTLSPNTSFSLDFLLQQLSITKNSIDKPLIVIRTLMFVSKSLLVSNFSSWVNCQPTTSCTSFITMKKNPTTSSSYHAVPWFRCLVSPVENCHIYKLWQWQHTINATSRKSACQIKGITAVRINAISQVW